MDWQTPLTVLLAAACAAYLLRAWLRPLFGRVGGACGACPSCGGEEEGVQGLLQIDAAGESGKDGASRR